MNFVVAGPPGSGKTTWVKQNAQRGDVIVDLDLLFVALSGRVLYDKPESLLPVVWAARDAVVDQLAAEGVAGDAYVITASPQRSKMQALCNRLRAELVLLNVDAETCKQRLRNDVRRDSETDWSGLVDAWWDEFQEEDHARRLRLLQLAEVENG